MSVWEGSGNVQALDVLRAMRRDPEALSAFYAELDLAGGANRRLDAAVRELRDLVAGGVEEAHARELTGLMARCLQAALLVRHAPNIVSDAYCAAKLESSSGIFGSLPAGIDAAAIVERHRVSQ
jgi:putative acyl-CoA dehydrogenase